MYIYRIIKIYIKTEKIPLLIFNLKLLQDKCCHLIIFNFRLKQIRIPTKNKQYSGTYDYKKKKKEIVIETNINLSAYYVIRLRSMFVW